MPAAPNAKAKGREPIRTAPCSNHARHTAQPPPASPRTASPRTASPRAAKDTMPQAPETQPAPERSPRKPVRHVNRFAALTGFGLAGLFDSLVIYRLPGWNPLLSASEPDAPLGAQIRHHAAFDAVMYLALLAGLAGLLSCRKTLARINPRCVAGMALIGFGLCHVADAVLIHWLLGLHRIHPAAEVPLLWDIGWLASFGLLPLLVGFTMRDTTPAEPPPPPGQTRQSGQSG